MKPQIEYTEVRSVSCKGLEAPYDHPLIYLTIKSDSIHCPYCQKEFVIKKDSKTAHIKTKT